jgi:AraC-like DNA-binding protein
MIPTFHAFVRIFHLFVFIRQLALIRAGGRPTLIIHSSIHESGLKAGNRAWTEQLPDALPSKLSRKADWGVLREHRLPYASRSWMRDTQILIVQVERELPPFLSHALAQMPSFGATAKAVCIAHDRRDILRFCDEATPDLVILNLLGPQPGNDDMLATLLGLLPAAVPIIVVGAHAILPSPSGSGRTRLQSLTHAPLVQLLEDLLGTHPVSTVRSLPQPAAPSHADIVFRHRLTQYISEHLTEPSLTVIRAARDLGYSRAILQKRMGAIFGLPFKRYLIDRRLDAARAIFDLGESNVTQCGFATGFSNLNYFTRAFRRRFGMTPRQYVRSLRDRSAS